VEPIRISYFSDVLCVWAYIAQIRLDELKSALGDKIVIEPHFSSVFGDAHPKLEKNWRRDFELTKKHTLTVSPTLIFNESRQRLYGNVGYRVVEANIRELLHNPPG
jgi:predicted DsbA family dithiol-disulfide isomerase